MVVRPVMRTGRPTARTFGRSHRQPGRSADRYDGSELGASEVPLTSTRHVESCSSRRGNSSAVTSIQVEARRGIGGPRVCAWPRVVCA